VTAEDEEPKNKDDRRPDAERRSGDERRKRRSSFVERIGRARGRRSGDDGRSGDGDRRSKS
jgi:hypothetical protein